MKLFHAKKIGSALMASCLLATPVMALAEGDSSLAGISALLNVYFENEEHSEDDLLDFVLSNTMVKTTVAKEAVALHDIGIARAGEYVNVRQAPGTDNAIIGKLYDQSGVMVIGSVTIEDGEWYHIESGSVNGYVKAEYVVTGEEAQEYALMTGNLLLKVTTDGLNVRQRPNTNCDIVGYLNEGDTCTITSKEENFYGVILNNGVRGYVHKDYVEAFMDCDTAVSLVEEENLLNEMARLEEAAQKRREQVIEEARAAEKAKAQREEESRKAAEAEEAAAKAAREAEEAAKAAREAEEAAARAAREAEEAAAAQASREAEEAAAQAAREAEAAAAERAAREAEAARAQAAWEAEQEAAAQAALEAEMAAQASREAEEAARAAREAEAARIAREEEAARAQAAWEAEEAARIAREEEAARAQTAWEAEEAARIAREEEAARASLEAAEAERASIEAAEAERASIEAAEAERASREAAEATLDLGEVVFEGEDPEWVEPATEPEWEEPSEEPTTEEAWEEPTTEEPWEEPTTEEPWEEPTTEEPWEEPTEEEPEEPAYVLSWERQAVVDYAYSKLGCDYVWAAEGPYAFDCSGLVKCAYAQVGIPLYHQSGVQGQAGEYRSLYEAEPGDILWKSGHVGIYVGDGMCIHAANENVGVILSPVWACGFVCARNVLG